ncbi:MAG: A/G-specific adenine glycosylase [Micrococcus sp.]|nr:A/G-specific adenine glycosylase [Micrococcus sp.]
MPASGELSAQRAAALHTPVLDWFEVHARDLPWRSPQCSPWGVLVSEIMLQQTPVIRVLPRWQDWMTRWPTPADLAQAPTSEVLTAWDRLGYPRRALRLQEAARAVVERHDGVLPADPVALRALPGIGEYTAAAVSSFAFGIPETVVDTNVRRVIERAVGGGALPPKSLTRAEMRRAQSLIPAETDTANRWNAAVMELGALVCTARSPRCESCPLLEQCAWVAAGKPAPVEQPKAQAWHGTDRQVRGAIMAAIRAHTDIAEADLRQRVEATGRLGTHVPEQEQWQRCLAGLLGDGLVERSAEGRLRFPACALGDAVRA